MAADGSRYEFPDPPPPTKAVPAVQCFDMRGARVIVGAAGRGWRGDLRADDPIMRGGELWVPVLPESEFYRSEDDGDEAIAALHPVETVWVEQADPAMDRRTAPPHLFERLVDNESPPTRYPVPASDVHGLTGRRVWVWRSGEFLADLRCVCEAFENSEGDIAINVCAERDWYRWARTGKAPRIDEALIHLAWVEH
ncbi:hypothetical protein LX16_2936 [Stackebrandtia albiflava]|uniref:Uncharacterized protein n=1 Tax=Stackebrandtia albiflava TaxID=406432 RepID=A0A562V2T6_9ACTN|nr:hypothetical protein [Stackebrandtia albiflava]TWJ12181.1 hypothetical protein LX16_2936 [Stackebrandtia albiflava]